MHSYGIIVSLCDLTGNMVRPWAEAGYECYAVDIQHSIRRDRADLRSATPMGFARAVFEANHHLTT